MEKNFAESPGNFFIPKVSNTTLTQILLIECFINGISVKPGYSKIGTLWFLCNDAGLTGMGEAKCGSHQFEEIWNEENLRKRCEYRNGRMVIVDIYCINEGELLLPGQLVISEDANSAMICSRERNGTLVWEVATDAEILAWWSRYVRI